MHGSFSLKCTSELIVAEVARQSAEHLIAVLPMTLSSRSLHTLGLHDAIRHCVHFLRRLIWLSNRSTRQQICLHHIYICKTKFGALLEFSLTIGFGIPCKKDWASIWILKRIIILTIGFASCKPLDDHQQVRPLPDNCIVPLLNLIGSQMIINLISRGRKSEKRWSSQQRKVPLSGIGINHICLTLPVYLSKMKCISPSL